ncbi:hypothetical protein PHMEG_0006777 [Phytophthora megakarya]|uniref:Uncharacterized protein n=1 Tax=Phytophthora megakarya TaxID=4795 RepID=A0A225WN24_9STRA|nr:hypothetical protein PHMEG_0006777 [Phytophthora megakarya]
MKIHAYLNRIVKPASEAQTRAKPTLNLTSHSFSRGGAQHTNGDATLSALWIFDRVYEQGICVCTHEDQKVARVQSGWDASTKPQVPTSSWFDSATREQARDIANPLFPTNICAVDPSVCEVLTASLFQHFPEVLERYPMCPYVPRMRIILFEFDIAKTQLLAWSFELQHKSMNKTVDPEGNGALKYSREDTLINYQNCVISELVAMNQALAKRVTELEKQQAQRDEVISVSMTSAEPRAAGEVAGNTSSNTMAPAKPKSCGSKSHSKWPASIWYEWYAKTSRLWDVCENRQKKSAYKKIVNYVKIFLPNGFKMDPSSPTYCDHALEVGQQSEDSMFKVFVAHGAKRKSGSSVLKQLRKYYNDG